MVETNEAKSHFEDLIATRDEALHEDLRPWVEHDGLFGPMLRHPLVYSVPLFHNGMANRQYEAKQDLLRRAESACDWHSYVFAHERPHRFDALQSLLDDGLDLSNRLVRSVWMDSENIWQNYDEWVELFSEARPDLMDEEEAQAFAALPEVLTLYRGAQEGLNEDGLSWTLDEDRAVWFARRFEAEDTVVLQAMVAKSRTIGLFLGRGEDEVLVLPENLRDVTVLDLP